PQGIRCPFGSHIRRANPRDDVIASNVGFNHRIIRRGMPYGKAFDPNVAEERGLLGLFICVNLQDQFEFIMKNWMNISGFNGNLSANHKDPFMGSDNDGREFSIPSRRGSTVVE